MSLGTGGEDVYVQEPLDGRKTCLGKYLDIFLMNAQISNSQDDKRSLFYRGQSDKTYPLDPSIFRNGLLPREHLLINDMLLNAPDEFRSTNMLERLIKMQHYGLPTRLLDISTNPMVALYFACCKNQDQDGEVIVFYDYIQRPHEINPRCLAALSEYTGSSERQMLGFLTERGFSNPELGQLTSITHVLIKPPLNNERIKRQQGAFIIAGVHGDQCGNPFQKERFDLKPLLVKDFKDGISRSIAVPKEDKKIILKELETFGINHRFLFPELEHQAAYFKSKYEEV